MVSIEVQSALMLIWESSRIKIPPFVWSSVDVFNDVVCIIRIPSIPQNNSLCVHYICGVSRPNLSGLKFPFGDLGSHHFCCEESAMKKAKVPDTFSFPLFLSRHRVEGRQPGLLGNVKKVYGENARAEVTIAYD